jgi:hypothetical protein
MKLSNPIATSVVTFALTLVTNSCANHSQATPGEELPTCEGKCDGPIDPPASEIAASPCDGIIVDLFGRNNSKW